MVYFSMKVTQYKFSLERMERDIKHSQEYAPLSQGENFFVYRIVKIEGVETE